MKRWRD